MRLSHGGALESPRLRTNLKVHSRLIKACLKKWGSLNIDGVIGNTFLEITG